MSEPQDPVTELASMAQQFHELWREYVKAGFTEAQALYLIGQHIVAAGTGPK